MRRYMMFALFVFAMSISSANAQPSMNNMLMGYHVSLGNSTCNELECDIAWINFELPIGVDKPQYLKFIITPECFADAPYDNETWGIDMYCSNDMFNETINMKNNMCNPADPIIRWVEINQTDTGIYVHQSEACEGILGWLWCLFTRQTPTSVTYTEYEDFWCAWRRDGNSTDRVPIEFSVIVDSLGITNPTQESVLDIQRNSGATILSSIKNIMTYNFNTLEIIFYMVSSVVIIIGFMIMIGLVPIMLKWMFKKASGG